MSSVARENQRLKIAAKQQQDKMSNPTTVKTLDILRLINGVNKAAEKSKKLEALLKQALEQETPSQIDETLLQQEGIGYDQENDNYYDLSTG